MTQSIKCLSSIQSNLIIQRNILHYSFSCFPHLLATGGKKENSSSPKHKFVPSRIKMKNYDWWHFLSAGNIDGIYQEREFLYWKSSCNFQMRNGEADNVQRARDEAIPDKLWTRKLFSCKNKFFFVFHWALDCESWFRLGTEARAFLTVSDSRGLPAVLSMLQLSTSTSLSAKVYEMKYYHNTCRSEKKRNVPNAKVHYFNIASHISILHQLCAFEMRNLISLNNSAWMLSERSSAILILELFAPRWTAKGIFNRNRSERLSVQSFFSDKPKKFLLVHWKPGIPIRINCSAGGISVSFGSGIGEMKFHPKMKFHWDWAVDVLINTMN